MTLTLHHTQYQLTLKMIALEIGDHQEDKMIGHMAKLIQRVLSF